VIADVILELYLDVVAQLSNCLLIAQSFRVCKIWGIYKEEVLLIVIKLRLPTLWFLAGFLKESPILQLIEKNLQLT